MSRQAFLRLRSPCALRSRLLLLAVWLVGCQDSPSGTPAEPQGTHSRGELDPGSALMAGETNDTTVAPLSLTLPFAGTANSSLWAFRVKQIGVGPAGSFEITNSSSLHDALLGQTSGGSNAVRGITTGPGRAGFFEILNSRNFSIALEGQSRGLGYAVAGLALGSGGAGLFRITNPSNDEIALLGHTSGSSTGVMGLTTGPGRAGFFQIHNSRNPSPALGVQTNGIGPALQANHTGASGALAVFQTAGVNQARISRTGKGFFNGGTQTGGADVAEAFEVEGEVRDYAPGDVLVISDQHPRRVQKSDEAYSTRVIGVYATKPGLLLSERDIDDSLDDAVPLGVLGVLPTRVSAENGAIGLGDLLVTAGTPGHAMRAEPVEVNGIKLFPHGSLLGKALEPFAGPGTGVIRVMVNVK